MAVMHRHLVDLHVGDEVRCRGNRLVTDILHNRFRCIAPGSLDTSLSHAAGLSDIAVCHA